MRLECHNSIVFGRHELPVKSACAVRLRIISLLIFMSFAIYSARATELADGWNTIDSGGVGLLWDISFVDEQNGWLCGIRSISKTANGGRSWKACWRSKDAFWFNSIAALDAKSAIAAGFAYGRQAPGIVAYTKDGGITWTNMLVGESPQEQFSSIRFFPNRKTGFVISTSRGLLRTEDGGLTWVKNSPPPPSAQPAWVASACIISLLGDSFIAVPSGYDNLALSDDCGKTWREVPLNVNADRKHNFISRLYFSSPKRAWLTFLDGYTLETEDGGAAWNICNAPGKVFLQDGSKGWALTSLDVFPTDDSGRRWGEALRLGSSEFSLVSMTFTKNKAYLVGGREGTGSSFLLARSLAPVVENEADKGVVPISFKIPGDGFATIQILDEKGDVVQNVVAGKRFNAGENTVWWDLGTLDEFWPPFRKSRPFLWEAPADAVKIAEAGNYRWRGIWSPGLDLEYQYSFCPLLRDGVAWLSEDKKGGWLADHEAPRTLVRNGDSMWIGAFNEEGDTLIQTDFDIRKQWGTQRIQLACPRVLASDGDFVYFIACGGWLSAAKQSAAFVQVDPKTHVAKKLFSIGDEAVKPVENGTPAGTFSRKVLEGSGLTEVEGLVVRGNLVYIGDKKGNRILVADLTDNLAGKSETMKLLGGIPVDSPAGMRAYPDGRIAVVSGKSVLLIDTETGKSSTAVQGLENPFSLAVDGNGSFFVGEMEPLHQVKVYGKDGKLSRVIGKPGGHVAGKFDHDRMSKPTGLELDPEGNLWVCENNYDLKRVSVWDSKGHCVKQVLGPTEYGGGGSLDPQDENRAFLAGKEYRRDPKTGEVRLEKILWRYDDRRFDSFVERRPHNFNGTSPEYPFWRDGKLFFSLWGGYGIGEITVLWVYAGDELRPVAAVGAPPKWLNERIGAKDDAAKSFAWTDRNDDGRVQPDEVKTSSFALGSAVWGVRMNQDFSVAFTAPPGPVGISFCKVAEITDKGYPVYELPSGFKMAGFKTWDPNQVQNVYMDKKGNAVAISPFIFSMSPDGKVNWRYVCRWPGLHAGRNTTTYGDEPGVLVSPLRCYGSAVVNPEIGEVFCLGTDYGATHFITADGLYVGKGFTDARRGIAWSFNRVPSPDDLKTVTLDGEAFGGSFQASLGSDGKNHFLYVVAPGGPSAVVVEQKGLDKVRRIEGASFKVASDDCRKAIELRTLRGIDEKTDSKTYAVRKAREVLVDGKIPEWPVERVNGFSMTYDDNFLYISYDGPAGLANFKNGATDDEWKDAFRKGDVLDIMIGTGPNAARDRQKPAPGDIRLSLVPIGENVKAILYDYSVPGADKKKRVEFASPWWVTTIDSISMIPDAKIAVIRRAGGFTLEAAIPLSAIHLDPKKSPIVSGDFGRCISEQTGTRTVDRRYWSDNSTLMIGDLSIEARITPGMWGEFSFE
ncbi:MAG: hypothetical protein WAX69_21635 [Victivallales bacterium]